MASIPPGLNFGHHERRNVLTVKAVDKGEINTGIGEVERNAGISAPIAGLVGLVTRRENVIYIT